MPLGNARNDDLFGSPPRQFALLYDSSLAPVTNVHKNAFGERLSSRCGRKKTLF
jgi:hypothetical protein